MGNSRRFWWWFWWRWGWWVIVWSGRNWWIGRRLEDTSYVIMCLYNNVHLGIYWRNYLGIMRKINVIVYMFFTCSKMKHKLNKWCLLYHVRAPPIHENHVTSKNQFFIYLNLKTTQISLLLAVKISQGNVLYWLFSS